MELGFTGTQVGMTQEQARMFETLVREIFRIKHEVTFHHGDCIGADMQAHALFHDVAVDLQAPSSITIHPPETRAKRAFADKARHGSYRKIPVTVLAEFPYMQRNEHIVKACSCIIATPAEAQEQQRSGTWATIRRARQAGKRLFIIEPAGDIRDARGMAILWEDLFSAQGDAPEWTI